MQYLRNLGSRRDSFGSAESSESDAPKGYHNSVSDEGGSRKRK